MAADKEAIRLSRVYSRYSNWHCNLPLDILSVNRLYEIFVYSVYSDLNILTLG